VTTISRAGSPTARIATVARKEIVDIFRDRRTMLITLVTAIVAGPVLMLLVLNLIARQSDKVRELVQALGIAGIADRRTQGFSQGERMKVAIARALVHDPQTILLDEPTNGLDIMGTRALRALLRDLRSTGKCLLFSSHVMQEVTALCDSIVIVGHGRVVASGTAAELVAQSGETVLEDAFVRLLGSGEGLAA